MTSAISRRNFLYGLGAASAALSFPTATFATGNTTKPNVLMIAVDDLNDWIGCLGGHPQTKTPNIDKLAARGVNFTNAHCQSPLCNPSRASIMSGTYAWNTGVYGNMPTNPSEKVPTYWDRDKISTMGEYFGANGYKTMGVGKIFHQSKWKGTFQEYGNGGSFGPYPEKKLHPNDISHHFDWGRYPENDKDTTDAKTADWAVNQLKKAHDKPFFLAVGFVRPHSREYCPAKWFDLIGQEDDIQLPPIKADDNADLPKVAATIEDKFVKRIAFLKEHNLHKSIVHAYLACIAFVDDKIGRVLDALAASPYADNTLIVLWSDHGYHLGEKERKGKYTLWQRSSHTPFMFAGPNIPSGKTCDQPVGLIDLYPTLMEYCQLPPPTHLQGVSLMPQLKDQNTPHAPVLVTTEYKCHAVVSQYYRYIRYEDGSEEFYDSQKDPHEWHNLAGNPEYRPIMDKLAKHLPTTNNQPVKRKRKK